jgi:hypothetical protein
MEENVARILQMLQEGKVTVQEATALIAAVRGEQAAPASEEKSEKRRRDNSWCGGGWPFWFWMWLLCCTPRRCRRW